VPSRPAQPAHELGVALRAAGHDDRVGAQIAGDVADRGEIAQHRVGAVADDQLVFGGVEQRDADDPKAGGVVAAEALYHVFDVVGVADDQRARGEGSLGPLHGEPTPPRPPAQHQHAQPEGGGDEHEQLHSMQAQHHIAQGEDAECQAGGVRNASILCRTGAEQSSVARVGAAQHRQPHRAQQGCVQEAVDECGPKLNLDANGQTDRERDGSDIGDVQKRAIAPLPPKTLLQRGCCARCHDDVGHRAHDS